MRAPTSHPSRLQRRVACLQFSEDDLNALRSLLGLLDPYLKQEWEVAAAGQADLVLARVDHAGDRIDVSADTPVIACVRRPRQHDAPAIHRPLRASEILAVLNEFDESGTGATATPTPPRTGAPVGRCWRLAFWPLDFESYPPAWQQMLAALSARSLSLQELTRCTGIARTEIDRCMQVLQDCGALTESSSTTRPSDPSPTRWRHLIAGIGRKLGLKA